MRKIPHFGAETLFRSPQKPRSGSETRGGLCLS
jgi:hypothetical protein